MVDKNSQSRSFVSVDYSSYEGSINSLIVAYHIMHETYSNLYPDNPNRHKLHGPFLFHNLYGVNGKLIEAAREDMLLMARDLKEHFEGVPEHDNQFHLYWKQERLFAQEVEQFGVKSRIPFESYSSFFNRNRLSRRIELANLMEQFGYFVMRDHRSFLYNLSDQNPDLSLVEAIEKEFKKDMKGRWVLVLELSSL